MKSSPASSASLASARQSSQLADQRSGTLVAERPDEQLAPKSPILSALALYMATRSCMDAVGASTAFSIVFIIAIGRYPIGRPHGRASPSRAVRRDGRPHLLLVTGSSGATLFRAVRACWIWRAFEKTGR